MTGKAPLDLPPTTAPGEAEELHRLRLSRDAALGAAQAAVRDATRLTRLLTILNDAGSLERLLDRTLSTLSEIFAAEVVVLLDPAGTGSFVPLASVGLPEDLAELPFRDAVDGNVSRTMAEAGALIIGDVAADGTAEPQLAELDVQSIVYLPVVASHAARGVLILARCRPEPFAFADVGLLTAMAYRIGLAVEQAQRRNQLERIVHREREIGLDLEEVAVARRAVADFVALVGANGATLACLDDTGQVRFHEDAGTVLPDDATLRELISRTASPSGHAEPVSLIAAPRAETPDAPEAGDGRAAIGATLIVPFGHGRSTGRILAFRSTPTPFDPDVLTIAVLHAGQTAAALENARLYRAVRSELGDRRRAERALKASQARLGALIRSVHDLILVIGAGGEVSVANPAAARVFGPATRVNDASFRRRIRAGDLGRFDREFALLGSCPGATRTVTVALVHGSADWHDYEVTLTNLTNVPAIGGIVATFHDVTERRIHERRLEDLAFRDPLTGLANRAHFQERLRLALADPDHAAGDVAVIFFDLDAFKVVNDSLGHEAGDVILKTVAERMRAVLSPGALGARLGGDEFTVLLERGVGLAEARRVAERLLEAIRAPVGIGHRDVVVGGSFGIAVGEAGRETAEDLLRKADVAMYHAKAGGRNTCAVFHPGLATAAVRRLEEETNLRTALARAELEVFFQPVVSLTDRRLTGAEALVRWRHPERGLVLPGAFVPVAEATGLIVELGRVVIDEVFRRSRLWREGRGVALPIGVNLSPRQLVDDGLIDWIDDRARRHRIDPATIVFEITENSFVGGAGTGTGVEVLDRLRARGFRIAIDDFATGYSSLAYLKTLPVDRIKIDRSFVIDVDRDRRDRAIVESVISLARALGLDVIAEGVEREAQAATLVELGCTAAQGFLFAPALSADDFAAFLSLVAEPGAPSPVIDHPAPVLAGARPR